MKDGRVNKAILREIAKRYFIGQPVKIGQRVEGQKLTKSNAYLLGCYAGPAQSEEFLFHEMCHLAERETDKLLEKPFMGWGFTYGKYWEIAGQSGYEPQTDQGVLREARVWSYQLSLMRNFQLPITAFELVGSAVYLPAWCHFKFRAIPDAAERKKLGYSESEALAISKLAEWVEKCAEEYSFAKFEENWFHRMEILR